MGPPSIMNMIKSSIENIFFEFLFFGHIQLAESLEKGGRNINRVLGSFRWQHDLTF